MERNPWWKPAAWISGGTATVLSISAWATARHGWGDRLVLVAAAMVAGFAAIWWIVAAGLCARRRWGVQLGAAIAVLNLLQGAAAGLNPGAAARALAEQGISIQNSPLSAALGWLPTLGSALVLASLLMLQRSGKRQAKVA